MKLKMRQDGMSERVASMARGRRRHEHVVPVTTRFQGSRVQFPSVTSNGKRPLRAGLSKLT